MARYELIVTVDNLTPPDPPVVIRGITVERHDRKITLTPELVEDIIKRAGLNLPASIDLKQAAAILPKLAVECQIRSTVEAPDERAALDRRYPRLMDLIMAIQLLTVKAVQLTGWMVGPAGGRFFPLHYRRDFPGGPATINAASQLVIEELMTVLEGSFPKRIDTAILEFDTALKSDDVRRQFIHSIVALEALFGDQSTEALRYKVPLRASRMIPSLSGHRKEGFNTLKKGYDLRSAFVHGTWTEQTLKEATARIDEILQLTAEAVQEFLFRVRDGRPVDFPSLDDELFFGAAPKES